MKKIFCLIVIIAAILFVDSGASADELHYVNLLIGDRASGIGGAYTAVSDDATGLYYNPAGIAYSSVRSFSASVNAFYSNDKTYKGVIGGNGWTRRSSSLLPNYFGVVLPIGNVKVGFSYAVPDSIMEDQSQTFANLPLNTTIQPYNLNTDGTNATITSYIINFNNENNVYEFGPSVAAELTDKLSAGLTLYYYQRKALWILNQIIKTTNGGYELTNQYYHANEKGVRPVLGFMWSPADKVSVGLSLSKIFIYDSDTSSQFSYDRQGICLSGTDCNLVSLPDGPSGTNAKRTTPKQISFGIAWFPTASLLLTTDVNYFSAKSVGDIVAFKGHSASNIEDVVNIALGSEYYFTKNWAMRAGLYTDFANSPKVSSGEVNQPEHIDLYGGTLSISSFTRNTSATLGGGYTYGTGKAQIISQKPGDIPKIQDAESQGWMVFLSSSYSY